MQIIEALASSSPNVSPVDTKTLSECADACASCHLACDACADACLGEDTVEMLRRCIRMNLDCADICVATGHVVSRSLEPDLGVLGAQLETCARVCAACAAECDKHATHHEHCRVCAAECRRCETACRNAASQLPVRA